MVTAIAVVSIYVYGWSFWSSKLIGFLHMYPLANVCRDSPRCVANEAICNVALKMSVESSNIRASCKFLFMHYPDFEEILVLAILLALLDVAM